MATTVNPTDSSLSESNHSSESLAPLDGNPAPLEGSPKESSTAPLDPNVHSKELALELSRHTNYHFGKCSSQPLDGFGNTTYLQGAHILANSESPPSKAIGYWALARCFNSTTCQMLVHGREMTELQLYMEAIKCDPDLAYPYYNIGVILNTGDFVYLPDGRKLDDKLLFVETIRCDDSFADAFFNLGVGMHSDEKITLADGRTLSQYQVCSESPLHVMYRPSCGLKRSCAMYCHIHGFTLSVIPFHA